MKPMATLSYFGLVTPLLLVLSGDVSLAETTVKFYVATDGRDDWSGRIDAPRADGADGPFRTIQRARDAMRERKALISAPFTVLVRGGKYFLKETLVLSTVDNGTREHPVHYTAYPGEKPVLSGGLHVIGWKPYKGKILRAQLPGGEGGKMKSRQLFFNGKRQMLARWPSSGWANIEGPAEPGSHIAFVYKEGGFPSPLAKPTEAEVNVYPFVGWTNNIVPIQSVDRDNRIVTLTRKVWDASDVAPWFWGMPFMKENRFAVENVLEELDQPGEWFLDSAAGVVYFWPPEVLAEDSEVLIPSLDTLIRLHKASYVTFSGFSLTETTGGDAYHRPGLEAYGAMYPVRGWKYCGESMHLKDCSYCVVEKNHFDAVGGNALYLEGYNLRNRIRRNQFSHIGANGICLLGTKDRHPMFNHVVDNHIHHCGAINNYVAGVFLGLSDGNLIAHNSIHDMPHHAVNLASNGYGRNIIEYNDIRRVSTELWESPGINSWMDEVDPSKSYIMRDAERAGHIIRHNFLEQTQGIAFDDYASNCVVYGNIVVGKMGFGVHGGKNNVFENNILVECKQYGIVYSDSVSERPASWQMSGFNTGNRFRNNIIYCTSDPEKAFLYTIYYYTDRLIAESDYNLFFNAEGRYMVLDESGKLGAKELPLDDWQKLGYDTNSLIGDPLFVDPKRGDYRLRPESPAFQLGFQPIPIDRIGIRPE